MDEDDERDYVHGDDEVGDNGVDDYEHRQVMIQTKPLIDDHDLQN